MLIDNNGNKPYQIEITEQTWKETKQVIINGINKKLVAARRLIVNDKEVAAGLYIYAVEEFGKLLLLLETKLENNIRKIKYRNEFLNHNVKFSKALDYLEAHNYNKCIVLNDEGGFSAESFSWRGFTIGLLPKTEARLSIFYTDFIYTNNGKTKVDIMKTPTINTEILNEAIRELENALHETELDKYHDN